MLDNVDSMFYVGDMPWHREGVALNEPPNTIAAIEYAGLDWKVSKVNLYSEDRKRIDEYYGIKRNDTGDVLGIVKGGYNMKPQERWVKVRQSGYLQR